MQVAYRSRAMKEYLQAIAELLVIMLDNLYKSWKINQTLLWGQMKS